MKKLVWIAHPYGGSVASLSRAKRWMLWAINNFPDVVPVMNWILYCELLNDSNPAHRELGLDADMAVAGRCEEIWLVGGRVSAGMTKESAEHPVVFDLTYLGEEPPAIGADIKFEPWRRDEIKAAVG